MGGAVGPSVRGNSGSFFFCQPLASEGRPARATSSSSGGLGASRQPEVFVHLRLAGLARVFPTSRGSRLRGAQVLSKTSLLPMVSTYTSAMPGLWGCSKRKQLIQLRMLECSVIIQWSSTPVCCYENASSAIISNLQGGGSAPCLKSPPPPPPPQHPTD